MEKSTNLEDLYNAPQEPKKDTALQLFRDILKSDDSIKTGNLDPKTELGVVKVGLRDFQNMAIFAESQGLDVFADYLRAEGEILAASSMSKNGFFTELLVTNIKKETKSQGQPKIRKSGIWPFQKTEVVME